jgi:hypothetical protein
MTDAYAVQHGKIIKALTDYFSFLKKVQTKACDTLDALL